MLTVALGTKYQLWGVNDTKVIVSWDIIFDEFNTVPISGESIYTKLDNKIQIHGIVPIVINCIWKNDDDTERDFLHAV